MARFMDDPSIQVFFTARLNLNESQAKALIALFGYSPDTIFKVWQEHLGKAYVKDFGIEDIRALAAGVHEQLSPALHKMQVIRDVLSAKDVEAMMKELLDSSSRPVGSGG